MSHQKQNIMLARQEVIDYICGMKKRYTLYIIGALLAACTDTTHFEPQPIVNLVSAAVRDSMPAGDGAEVDALLKVVGDSTLSQWSASRAVAVFSPDAEAVFPSLELLEQNLGYTLERARELGVSLPPRRYAAVVYGKPEAIMFVDSVMLIALNHYLGANYPGYAGLPEYMRAIKTPDQLPYAMAEALTGVQYPYAESLNATLLSRMLYDGAMTRAKMQLTLHAKPWEALGYDKATYDHLLKSEKNIWEALVQSRLIFDTSEATVDRICAPAPFVSLNGEKWPGRVGRFIGWRIVEAYVKNNPQEAGLTFLLSPDFYNSDRSLEKAKY